MRTFRGGRPICSGHELPAFIAARCEGYGDAGHGPIRTRWMLTGARGREAYNLLALLASRTDLPRAGTWFEGPDTASQQPYPGRLMAG